MRRVWWIAGAVIALAAWAVTRPFALTTIAPAPTRLPAAIAVGDRPLSLVILGTSLSVEAPWTAALARRLESCLGVRVAMRVVARGGATSRWGAEQLPQLLGPAPDLVLIEFTANDADLRRGLLPGESAALHREMLAQIGAANPEARVLLLSMNPISGLRRVARPALQTYLRGYHALAKADPRHGFVDLRPDWQAYLARHPEGPAIPDGLHPVPATAAEVMTAPLSGLIAGIYGRDTCPG